MPNLVGLQGIPPPSSVDDLAKHETMKAMQMEALGLMRREILSTTDFKENKARYVSTSALEPERLVNKSSIGKQEKLKLKNWNTAWTHLHDDGTDSQNLQDVNEGKGQTHRAKLMQDESIRGYTGESSFRGGARGGRDGRRGYDSKGSGGKARGEHRLALQLVSHQPITRVRVPKGFQPTVQPDVPRRQPAPILATISNVKPAKENVNIRKAPLAPIRQPITLAAPSAFMASIKQPRDISHIKGTSSAPRHSNENASGYNIGSPSSKIETITSSSNEQAMTQLSNTSAIDLPSKKTTTTASKSSASVGPKFKADLMDLDIGQETTQPVLRFTAPSKKEQPNHGAAEVPSSFDEKIEALEKSGVLTTAQLEALKGIQAQVHARENQLTSVEEAPRQATHTKTKLEPLSQAPVAFKVTKGIAEKFAQQQTAFLIGEHVHKTRYHTAASLTEDFEKLSITDTKPIKPTGTDIPSTTKSSVISDKEDAKPAVTHLPAVEKSSIISSKKPATLAVTTIDKSKINPFGPPPARGKGPSLPPHLFNQPSAADHGAAARAQHSGGHNILAPVSNRQSLKIVTAPARNTGRNMINETGFIALVENRVNVAAGKKGEDPLLVAQKRGL